MSLPLPSIPLTVLGTHPTSANDAPRVVANPDNVDSFGNGGTADAPRVVPNPATVDSFGNGGTADAPRVLPNPANVDSFGNGPSATPTTIRSPHDLLTLTGEGPISGGPFDPATLAALHQGLQRAVAADDAAAIGRIKIMLAGAAQHGQAALASSAAQLWPDGAPPLDAVAGWSIGLGSSSSGLLGEPLSPEAASQVGTAVQTAQGDPNAAVMQGLYGGYQMATQDLADFAAEVDHYNQVKAGLRDELSRARDVLASLAGLPDDAALDPPFDSKELDATYYGASRESGGQWSEGEPITTKAELEAYIENLEGQLETVGDDAQLAMLDLEQAMQKQQQWLEMMSNMMKMAHDTAMAIINNMKV